MEFYHETLKVNFGLLQFLIFQLKKIETQTPTYSTDYQSLNLAIDAMLVLSSLINDVQESFSNSEKVNKIAKQIQGFPVTPKLFGFFFFIFFFF